MKELNKHFNELLKNKSFLREAYSGLAYSDDSDRFYEFPIVEKKGYDFYGPDEGNDGYYQTIVFVESAVLNDGLKVYCPSVEEYISLSTAEINLTCDLYYQPFPVFTIYLSSEVRNSIGSNAPFAVIGRQCESSVFFLLLFEREDGSINKVIWISHIFDDRFVIEDLMDEVWQNADHYSEDFRHEVDKKYLRLFLNSCLLLSQANNLVSKPTNEEYAAKLKDTIAKKKIPYAVRRAAEEALKNLPMVYGFDQSVRIYEREDAPHDATGTGTPVKPHWRRGHWRHQPHGEKMGLRKLIFIPAVLVNSHRFAGELSNTRVSYHAPKKQEHNVSTAQH